MDVSTFYLSHCLFHKRTASRAGGRYVFITKIDCITIWQSLSFKIRSNDEFWSLASRQKNRGHWNSFGLVKHGADVVLSRFSLPVWTVDSQQTICRLCRNCCFRYEWHHSSFNTLNTDVHVYWHINICFFLIVLLYKQQFKQRDCIPCVYCIHNLSFLPQHTIFAFPFKINSSMTA